MEDPKRTERGRWGERGRIVWSQVTALLRDGWQNGSTVSQFCSVGFGGFEPNEPDEPVARLDMVRKALREYEAVSANQS